jgi:hypothetical protein
MLEVWQPRRKLLSAPRVPSLDFRLPSVTGARPPAMVTVFFACVAILIAIIAAVMTTNAAGSGRLIGENELRGMATVRFERAAGATFIAAAEQTPAPPTAD